MDIKQNKEFRNKRLKAYTINPGMDRYDYEKEGVLNKCLPKILFKGNPILVTFLQLIDLRFVMVMKYIERMRKFKWISWYN